MTTSQSVQLRDLRWNAVSSGGLAVLALIGLGYAVGASEAGPAGVVMGLIILAACGFFGIRVAAASVVLEPDGIQVRSMGRTVRIPWSDFAGAEAVRSSGPFPATVIGIKRQSGKVVKAEQLRSLGWLARSHEALRPNIEIINGYGAAEVDLG